MSHRSVWSNLWYEFLKSAMLFGFSVGHGIRHTGLENIPSEGGVLVVSNHQSHFDPPLVGSGCPRRMNYVARESLFWFPPFRWLIRSLDAIPINREGLGLSGIKESLRRLKRGEMVLIFPEGTRTEDGQVGSFLPGFSALAVRGRAAILPVAIEGAFDAWPRGRWFPRFGHIHVHYGRALLAEEVKQFGEKELLGEVRKRVIEAHAELQKRPALAQGRTNSAQPRQ